MLVPRFETTISIFVEDGNSTDSENDEPALAGVTVILKDADENEVASVVSGETVVALDVLSGTYTIAYKDIPQGYTSPAVYEVAIDGESVSVALAEDETATKSTVAVIGKQVHITLKK